LAREIEELGENLPHFYFVHHKSHMNLGLNPGRRDMKLGTIALYRFETRSSGNN
jgi:hypothetical protein